MGTVIQAFTETAQIFSTEIGKHTRFRYKVTLASICVGCQYIENVLSFSRLSSRQCVATSLTAMPDSAAARSNGCGCGTCYR